MIALDWWLDCVREPSGPGRYYELWTDKNEYSAKVKTFEEYPTKEQVMAALATWQSVNG